MIYTSREVCLPWNHYTSRQVYEYISRQTNDPIVERKTCAVSGTQFPIFQSDLDFYAKISPTFAGITYQIPTPTLCPEERQRRRLSFRNERKLYRRQCDASKKSIISIYSPDKPYKVYDQKIRWSDAWDPMEYGMDFDFSRTFTEQFGELMRKVPRVNLNNTLSEWSDYCNYMSYAKNCYLSFNGWWVNNYYCCNVSNGIEVESIDCIDCLLWIGLVNSYFCVETHFSQHCYYCIDCEACYDCYYCIDCVRCEFCIWCDGLRDKKYCIANVQYTKEEYMLYLRDNNITSVGRNTDIVRTNRYMKSEMVFWNSIRRSKNIILWFDVFQSHDVKYSWDSWWKWMWDYMDVTSSRNSLSYECIWSDGYSLLSCNGVGHLCDKFMYCDSISSSSNLFGCIGLRNKSYCVFNKQYTKEEYEGLVWKIIRHMQQTGERWEFFHPSLSPFWYNETVAQEYYELQNVQNVQKGSDAFVLKDSENSVNFWIFWYHRSTYNADPNIPEWVQTIERKNYSDEQRNSLLQEDNLETKVFLCSVSARPYRLQKAEIDFYRKHSLPIPEKHPDVRHEERMKLRPGRTLFLRTCDCCGKEMLSVYDQEHEWKVYCEECYQKEVYG